MTTGVYRGTVRGGAVVLENDPCLAEGTEVLVTPIGAPRGSPAAVLEALKAGPAVPTEWVDELEQLISEGRRPPSGPETFVDADSNGKSS